MPKIRVGRAHGQPIDLHVEDDGGAGRPLVLVHGASAPEHVPAGPEGGLALRSALRAAGWRVIAYDRRGHGRSGLGIPAPDLDTAADDLQHLLDVLDVQGGVLLAHGWGCSIAARYLGNCGGGRITRAVMLSPPALATGPAVAPGGAAAVEGDAAWADLGDDLPRIDVPMLVVATTADAGLPSIAARIEGARLVVLDAGLDTLPGGMSQNTSGTDIAPLHAALLSFLAEV